MIDEKIIGFIPQAELTASDNLEAFVEQAKRMLPTIFHETYDVDWKENIWHVGASLTLERRRSSNLYFTSEACGYGRKKSLQAFKGPFADFAKAYVVYFIKIKADELTPYRIHCLRFLYKELLKGFDEPDIKKADAHHFDLAANALKKSYPNEKTYGHYLSYLNALSDFVNQKLLVELPFRWRRKQPAVDKWRTCTSEDARKRRHEKLPDRETMEGVAKAFHIAEEPADQLVTSIMALLTCAPSRICEVFRATNDLYVQRKEHGQVVHAMRWRPGKGAKEDLKNIPEAMIDVFQKASKQIEQHTKAAREMALWYEGNRTSLYLPSELEHLRENPETLRPIKYFREIAWCDPNSTLPTWFETNGVKITRKGNGPKPRCFTTFAEVEKAILKLLPLTFPYTDFKKRLKFSEALIVLPYGFFHQYSSKVMLKSCTPDMFANRFTGHKGCESVFERLEIRRKDGDFVSIPSHDFRRWLNTIAQETGLLSQETIAMWSTRADIHQNMAYDFSDKEQHRKDAKEFAELNPSRSEKQIIAYRPVTMDEFTALRDSAPVHATKYGYCTHDYTMSPCGKFRDCLNCSEHCWLKGLKPQERQTKELLGLYRTEIEEAQKKIEEGEMSENNTWYETHQKAFEHLSALVNLMDDESIPERTPMMINVRDEYDPVVFAMSERHSLTGDETAAAAIKIVKLKGKKMGSIKLQLRNVDE